MAETLTVIFRKATRRDVPRLVELYMESFAKWSEAEKIPPYLADRTQNPDYNFIVAEDKPGHIAGFVIANCTPVESDGVMNVDVMTVDGNTRRLGLGKKLMHMAEMTARNAGALGVTLQVVDSNRPAQQLYLSLGFNFYGKLEHYYTDGADAYLMIKKLPPSPAANDQSHPATAHENQIHKLMRKLRLGR